MNFISQYLILLIFATLLLLFNYTNVVISASNTVTGPESEQIGIIKAIPFNNTILSSLAIDPISDLVYVSAIPDYSYNTSCLKENTISNYRSGVKFPCSTIYILDGKSGHINNSIRLRPGEIIHAMTIDPHSGKIFAAGEYNYLKNETEPIQYEDDVVFIINQSNSNSSQQSISSSDIQRIRLYGEQEELYAIGTDQAGMSNLYFFDIIHS